MSSRSPDPEHVALMRRAIDLARLSTADTSTRYRVGAVIASSETGDVLSTGYTGQLPGNTHAEECALALFAGSPTVSGNLDLYTSMQPCTLRNSGLKTCTERIVESGIIGRIFVGVGEPKDFVENSGYGALERARIEIVIVEAPGLADEALNVARGREDPSTVLHSLEVMAS